MVNQSEVGIQKESLEGTIDNNTTTTITIDNNTTTNEKKTKIGYFKCKCKYL